VDGLSDDERDFDVPYFSILADDASKSNPKKNMRVLYVSVFVDDVDYL